MDYIRLYNSKESGIKPVYFKDYDKVTFLKVLNWHRFKEGLKGKQIYKRYRKEN